MKKLLRLSLLLMVGVFILVGCSEGSEDKEAEWEETPYDTVNDVEGVILAYKEGTASVTDVTVIFENGTDKEYMYGEEFFIEKKVDDTWHQVPVALIDYGFIGIGYPLSPSSEAEKVYDWEVVYGELPAGTYRIVTSVIETTDEGGVADYHLAAEFMLE